MTSMGWLVVYVIGLASGAAPKPSRCQEFARYLAVTRALPTAAGDSIEVYVRGDGQSCRKRPKNTAVHFRWNRAEGADNDQLAGIAGDSLLVSTGSDVDSNSTIIVDLVKKKRVLEIKNTEGPVTVEGNFALYARKERELVEKDRAGCLARMEQKVKHWLSSHGSTAQVSLTCDCGALIKDAGEAAVVLHHVVDLTTQADTFLPVASCSFFQ